MKKECDANGLEYELIMQEGAKERFLRQIQPNNFDINKHFVALKQKRQNKPAAKSAPSKPAPTPAPTPAPAPEEEEEPKVGAAADEAEEPTVGGPMAKTSLAGAKAIAGLNGLGVKAVANLQSSKLMVFLKEKMAEAKFAPLVGAPMPPIVGAALPPLNDNFKLTIDENFTFPPFKLPSLKTES